MRERIQKVLARAGVASRRKCEELIKEGRVSINGNIVTELGTKVDLKTRIEVDGNAVRSEKLVYFLLNKPKGILSTVKDDLHRKTVTDLVRCSERLYPVGRLDKDSEGLILLTNDGELCNKITHPRFSVKKEYRIVLKGELSDETRKRIEKGIWLSDGKTKPCKIRIIKYIRNEDVTILNIILQEGVNREVRRIFAKFGLKVKKLLRLSIGGLYLGNLKSGMYMSFNRSQIENALSGVKK